MNLNPCAPEECFALNIQVEEFCAILLLLVDLLVSLQAAVSMFHLDNGLVI